jgi:hypothetical protein
MSVGVKGGERRNLGSGTEQTPASLAREQIGLVSPDRLTVYISINYIGTGYPNRHHEQSESQGFVVSRTENFFTAFTGS